MKKVMKLNKLDFSVALFSGLACISAVVGMQAWVLFIGWAWYSNIKSNPFKVALPSMILSYILAGTTIVVHKALGERLAVMCIMVFVTILIIMKSLKYSEHTHGLVAFNAYSVMFAGYFSGSFPQLDASLWDINNVLLAVMWLGVGNVIGMLLGKLSVKVAEVEWVSQVLEKFDINGNKSEEISDVS